ncbi:GntR family transcriptional regulator [Methylobacterium sp. NPDC080182]|uniref:GntR family transcriptional regulator n=1 Tax=Methylobacterium sp. NPDC080182 TaxID=3390590 RepID=UPI003CFBE046
MAIPTVAEKVADELAARIVGGVLLPGAPLRQEVFVQEFGASHAAIREAFLRLEGRRLVVSEARRGFRVVELELGGEREVMMMRAALEVLALRQIGGRPGPKRMSKIEEALNAGEEARDLIEWEIANRSFHDRLAEASGLPRLATSIAELNIISSRYAVMRDRSTQWKPRSNHDHRRIFEALCDGHVEQAASLLDNHIRAVERVTRI